MRGGRHHTRSEEIYVNSVGYVCILIGTTHVLEHRHIAEQILGRKLLPGEIIHHIDGNKLNNSPDNLALTTDRKHKKYHISLNNPRSSSL